jgi:hypothetical protein
MRNIANKFSGRIPRSHGYDYEKRGPSGCKAV